MNASATSAAAGVPGPSRLAPRSFWEGLAELVQGPVYLPGSDKFRVHSESFNKRYKHKRPAAVICPTDVHDVRRAVRWSREHEVPLVARSGGHSFAGYSVNDGLVVDLGRLSQTKTNAAGRLVTVGGGARVAQLYDAVRPHQLTVPTGTSPRVGVAGLVLGGGCAYSSRKLGLTLDFLVSTDVVTADGEVLTCTDDRNEDLFWACRGGGGGNFGINVSFTFRAVPVPDVTTFDLTWNPGDTVGVLSAGQAVLQDAPDELSLRLGLSTHGANPVEAAANVSVTASGQFLGPARELASLLAPLRSAARPTRFEISERTYWEANSVLGHTTAGDAFALRSRYAQQPVPEEGLAEALAWVQRWPGSSSTDGGGIGLFAWGGQINRVAAGATAFVHRDTLLLASLDTAWTADDDPSSVTRHLDWLAGFHTAMGAYLSDQAYQNFPDPELRDWAQAYYGANYERLCRVKRAYDPDRVFDFGQAIGSLDIPRTALAGESSNRPGSVPASAGR